MTTPINQNLYQLHSADGIVELYILDCSVLGGGVYHFANQCYANGSLFTWGGQAYNVIPIGIEDKELKSDGTDLPQISISISNAPSGGPLLAAVQSMGDLVGATLTQYVTKASYLDAGSEPDTSQFKSQTWRIVQKAQQTNQSMVFVGAYLIDLPGQRLPIRQFLCDAGVNPDPYNTPALYFPGVSPFRTSQWQSQ